MKSIIWLKQCTFNKPISGKTNFWQLVRISNSFFVQVFISKFDIFHKGVAFMRSERSWEQLLAEWEFWKICCLFYLFQEPYWFPLTCGTLFYALGPKLVQSPVCINDTYIGDHSTVVKILQIWYRHQNGVLAKFVICAWHRLKVIPP